MCKANPNAPVIETYFNHDHYPAVLDPNARTLGLNDQSVRIRDNSLDCFTRRQIKVESNPLFYDLNSQFYLLVAKGPLNGKFNSVLNALKTIFIFIYIFIVTTNEPMYHYNKFISANKINFLSVN